MLVKIHWCENTYQFLFHCYDWTTQVVPLFLSLFSLSPPSSLFYACNTGFVSKENKYHERIHILLLETS